MTNSQFTEPRISRPEVYTRMLASATASACRSAGTSGSPCSSTRPASSRLMISRRFQSVRMLLPADALRAGSSGCAISLGMIRSASGRPSTALRDPSLHLKRSRRSSTRATE